MYIRRYTIAAFILMALVGWYVYAYITHDNYSLSFFGINLPSVSIALLIVVPMFILYLASVMHMGFYSILGSFKLKKYEKDYTKLLDALIEALLAKENRKHNFKTQRYQTIGKVVDNSKIYPDVNALENISNDKIREIVLLIKNLQNGESVNLKKYDLSAQNYLSVLNAKNRYKKGELSAEEIILNAKNHSEEFVKEIFKDFVKEASGEKIMKYYKEYISKEALFNILDRINHGKNAIELSNEELLELINSVKLDKNDYIKIAKYLAQGMVPENRMKLFEVLSESNDDATEAYLYTLFDLEMLDQADDILDAASPNEFQKFRAYKALRECNRNYNIDLFI
jgi:hypothetical protein